MEGHLAKEEIVLSEEIIEMVRLALELKKHRDQAENLAGLRGQINEMLETLVEKES